MQIYHCWHYEYQGVYFIFAELTPKVNKKSVYRIIEIIILISAHSPITVQVISLIFHCLNKFFKWILEILGGLQPCICKWFTSLQQSFITVGQNNFRNRIPFFIIVCKPLLQTHKLSLVGKVRKSTGFIYSDTLKECTIGHLECETEIQLRVPAWLKQFYFRFLLRHNCAADVIPMNPMAQWSFKCKVFQDILSNIVIWSFTSWSWLSFGQKSKT